MDTVFAPFAVTDEWQSQSSPSGGPNPRRDRRPAGLGGMIPTPLPSHQPSAIKAQDATSDRYQSGVHVTMTPAGVEPQQYSPPLQFFVLTARRRVVHNAPEMGELVGVLRNEALPGLRRKHPERSSRLPILWPPTYRNRNIGQQKGQHVGMGGGRRPVCHHVLRNGQQLGR